MALRADYALNSQLPSNELNTISDVANNNATSAANAATAIASASSDVTALRDLTVAAQQSIADARTTDADQSAVVETLSRRLAAAQSRILALQGGSSPHVPDAVTGLAAGATTTTTQVLTFTPASTGYAATSFKVRYAQAGTGAWVNSTTGGSSPLTVTGLTANTNYDYDIVAINAAGSGGICAPVTKRTSASFTPSPAWSTIPSLSSITMDDGGAITLVSGVVKLNGATIGSLPTIDLIVKADTGRIFARTRDPAYPSTGGWWYWNGSVWIVSVDPRPGANREIYFDGFDSTNDLQSTRAVASGNKWALIDINTPDGRGGPNYGENGSQFWPNIYTPGFSVPGLYSVSGGKLNLGLMATPSGIQAAVNSAAGASMPFVGTLVNSTPSYWLAGAYHEVVAAVPKIPGFTFQACLEAPSSVRWPPEIDIMVYTNADNTQHIRLNVWAYGGGSYPAATTTLTPGGWDGTVDNTYGLDVGATDITFYLNGTEVFQTPKPTDRQVGGVYDYDLPLQWYLLTASAYAGDLSNPDPASLPAFATVNSVTVWANTVAPPPGTRSAADIPFASDSVWNIGIGSGATWASGGAAETTTLRGLTVVVETSSWGQPIYYGTGTDPLVTFNCAAAGQLLGAAPWSKQFHIPSDAQPAGGTDRHLNVYDDAYPFEALTMFNAQCADFGALHNGSVITSTYGGDLDLTKNGVNGTRDPAPKDFDGDRNYLAGVINQYDIGQGVIRHAVRVAISPEKLLAPGLPTHNTPGNRVGVEWPNYEVDWSAPTGYTGNLPVGTYGIPASVDVTTLGLTTGGLMLARCLQDYGGIWRDQGGTNNLVFYSVPELAGNARIAEMMSDGAKITAVMCRMTNQSASNVNGGGTRRVARLPDIGGGLGKWNSGLKWNDGTKWG